MRTCTAYIPDIRDKPYVWVIRYWTAAGNLQASEKISGDASETPKASAKQWAAECRGILRRTLIMRAPAISPRCKIQAAFAERAR